MTGYRFKIDHIEYAAHRDGSPITLVEAWREVYGVARASIVAPDGRVVLANAGSLYGRGQFITQARKRNLRAGR